MPAQLTKNIPQQYLDINTVWGYWKLKSSPLQIINLWRHISSPYTGVFYSRKLNKPARFTKQKQMTRAPDWGLSIQGSQKGVEKWPWCHREGPWPPAPFMPHTPWKFVGNERWRRVPVFRYETNRLCRPVLGMLTVKLSRNVPIVHKVG